MIRRIQMRVPSPESSRRAWRRALPGVVDGTVSGRWGCVDFAPTTAPAGARDGDVLSNYWKVSVFCDDLRATRSRLLTEGWEVSEPHLFGDIGRMCHTRDRDGLAIELLQRTFAEIPGEPNDASVNNDVLGLVTLRVASIDRALEFYRDVLGTRLLATMDVMDVQRPFRLYFLAATDESPPFADPDATANREWLYQRPYTAFELQHYLEREVLLSSRRPGEPGIDHIEVEVADPNAIAARAERAGFATHGHLVTSPDEITVRLRSNDRTERR